MRKWIALLLALCVLAAAPVTAEEDVVTQPVEAAVAENPQSAYIRYDRELPVEKKEAFEDYQTAHNNDKEASGKISGVWFEPEFMRVYPYDTLACTVLGFSGKDSSKGNWGLEQYYNSYLVGTNGRSYGYMNQDGSMERTTKEAVNGCNIITTFICRFLPYFWF